VVKFKLTKNFSNWLKGIKMEYNLSTVSSNDLIQELVNRHDSIIISGIKLQDNKGNYLSLRRFNGNRLHCLGMLEVMKNIISNAEINDSVPVSGKET
jgi:hypothetical protein